MCVLGGGGGGNEMGSSCAFIVPVVHLQFECRMC